MLHGGGGREGVGWDCWIVLRWMIQVSCWLVRKRVRRKNRRVGRGRMLLLLLLQRQRIMGRRKRRKGGILKSISIERLQGRFSSSATLNQRRLAAMGIPERAAADVSFQSTFPRRK